MAKQGLVYNIIKNTKKKKTKQLLRDKILVKCKRCNAKGYLEITGSFGEIDLSPCYSCNSTGYHFNYELILKEK
jgi:hypothetical protein